VASGPRLRPRSHPDHPSTTNPEHTINLPRHRRDALAIFTAGLACLGLLSACASPEAATAPTTRTRETTTASTDRPPSTTTPATAPLGRPAAVKACDTWAVAGSKSAAEGSPDRKSAATQAGEAARLDPQWERLASEMVFLSSLPLTDNTPEDVARAEIAGPSVAAMCRTLGIDVGT
jgi:hypothetical protein